MSLPHDKAPVADAIGALSFARGLCGGAGHRAPCRRWVGLKRERSASAFPRSRVPSMRARSDAVVPVRSSRRRTRSTPCRVRSLPLREDELPRFRASHAVHEASSAHPAQWVWTWPYGFLLAGRWSPPLTILAFRTRVGKWFVGRLVRFPADVGEVSLAERPSLMRALGLRQGRRGPTIFTGQARQKSLPPSPLRGRLRGP